VSKENVELARRAMESAEAFVGLLDEYAVIDNRDYPLPDFAGVIVGRDAVAAMLRSYWGAFEEYVIWAEEYVDAGASVVLALGERGRGRGGGVPFDRRWAQVWTFRKGRIVRMEPFRSKEEALEAAGLRAADGE